MWCRRYGSWFFSIHVALFIASTALRPMIMMFMSFLQASFHLVFSRPFFLLHCISVISIFLLCALRPFSSHAYTISVVFLLFVLIWSDLIFLCYSTHTCQHPYLIRLYPCSLSFCYCPGLCSVEHCWSDYCFIDLQLHWRLLVAAHSTPSVFMPIHR